MTNYKVREYSRNNKPYLIIQYQADNKWKVKNVPVNIATTIKDEDVAVEWWEKNQIRPTEKTTINSLFETWKRLPAPNRRSNINNDIAAIKNHTLKHEIAEIDLSANQMQFSGVYSDFIETLRKKELAENTIRNIVQATKRVVQDLGSNGIIPFRAKEEQTLFSNNAILKNIYTKNTTDNYNEEEKKVLPIKTLQALLSFDFSKTKHLNRYRKHIFYLFAIATGCRASEIAGLTWENVSLEGEKDSQHEINRYPHIKIVQQLKRNQKENISTAFKRTKTEESRRIIPISKHLLQPLIDWKNTGWSNYTNKEIKPNDLVFTTNNAKPLAIDNFSKDLAADLNLAKQDNYITTQYNTRLSLDFHSFRRTNLSLLAENEIPGEIRRALAGHAAKDTQEKHYIKKSARLLKLAVDSIPVFAENATENGTKEKD